jgi:hypothetical protein
MGEGFKVNMERSCDKGGKRFWERGVGDLSSWGGGFGGCGKGMFLGGTMNLICWQGGGKGYRGGGLESVRGKLLGGK